MAKKEITNAELLKTLGSKLGSVAGDVADLKTDVGGLKTDMSGLKSDVADLKTEMTGLKTDVREIRETVSAHTEALDALARGVKNLQDEKTMRDKAIARLNFRTEKMLGEKLHTIDAEFEEQYRGAGG